MSAGGWGEIATLRFAGMVAVIALASGAVAPRHAAGERSEKRKPVAHRVVMEGTSFEPAALSLRLGDSVTWVNKDFFPHTATAADVFDSDIIAAGASWTHTPRQRGEIPYVCTLHPTMRGTLQVR